MSGVGCETRRPGRPIKAAEPGTRVSLGLKVTPAIKTALDEEARRNGRTQSQEAEARLEASFRDDRVVAEIRAATAAILAAMVPAAPKPLEYIHPRKTTAAA